MKYNSTTDQWRIMIIFRSQTSYNWRKKKPSNGGKKTSFNVVINHLFSVSRVAFLTSSPNCSKAVRIPIKKSEIRDKKRKLLFHTLPLPSFCWIIKSLWFSSASHPTVMTLKRNCKIAFLMWNKIFSFDERAKNASNWRTPVKTVINNAHHETTRWCYGLTSK